MGSDPNRRGHFELHSVMDHIRHYLPTQGPIKDFIHHNTLHAFQHLEFDTAVITASQLFGASSHLDLPTYEALYLQGKISDFAVREAVEQENDTEISRLFEKPQPFSFTDSTPVSQGIARSGLRASWSAQIGKDITQSSQPLLFRWVSAYLDQGIGTFYFVERRKGLLPSVRATLNRSLLPSTGFLHSETRSLLRHPAEHIIETILKEIIPDERYFDRYLLETALSNPGWSGMVAYLEANPGSVDKKNSIRLIDFIAIQLLIEHDLLLSSMRSDSIRLNFDPERIRPETVPTPIATLPQRVLGIWQKALEKTYYLRTAEVIENHQDQIPEAPLPVRLGAMFCIDDRECSLRRHLEEIDPWIQTYGAAGFFGVDCYFQNATAVKPLKHCPVPVQPKTIVREVIDYPRVNKKTKKHAHLDHEGIIGHFFNTLTSGVDSFVKLFRETLVPHLEPSGMSSLLQSTPDSRLILKKSAPNDSSSFSGYTVDEMAQRVAHLFQSTGMLRQKFPPLFVIMGHGASSTNNPYFSAYDCGACSGKAGGPNARAICAMANDPDVRALLMQRGIEIPKETWFIGAHHDTTRDEVMFYDTDCIPSNHKEWFKKFRKTLDVALERNAKERLRKFDFLFSEGYDSTKRAKKRSNSIFEPRPELNHATNAACIVGRRQITRGLNLERRSFLHSYDPQSDPDGILLQGILSAVVPVCGGINLEYYFSRIDPNIYGSGSKLSHNVMGLLGVSHGVDSDLLTGLPVQMTEFHDPIRLMLILDQTTEIVTQALRCLPEVHEWIRNGWIKLFCLDPRSSIFFEYKEGNFEPFTNFGKSKILKKIAIAPSTPSSENCT